VSDNSTNSLISRGSAALACVAAFAAAALVFAAASNATNTAAPASTLALKAGVFDPPRLAPDFSLQSSDGHELKISQYRGKVVLLAFGFTSCTEVCPTTLNTLAVARRKLGTAAANVQVVYITVDPERDVPARLAKYLGSFDPTFVGGTGTQAQLAAVRRNYGISAEKKVIGNDYTYAHSSFTYLIDRGGRIRALMPYGHSPDDYANDLTILLKE
jgi:protein SCO1/2